MTKMSTGWCLHTAIDEMKSLIKMHRPKAWEEKKWDVQIPGHKQVKTTIERHLAILCQNHMAGYLPCQNGTAKNPQTRLRWK